MNPFKLIDALAERIPTEDLARAVVRKAGVEPGMIAFDARAWMNWMNIVAEAQRQQMLDELIGAAVSLYPEAVELCPLVADYKEWAATHPASEQRLFIRPGEGEMPAAPASPAKPEGWNAVRMRSEKLTRRFLDGHRSGSGGAATFNPDLYVRREEAERQLEQFLAGSASAFILIGDSGVGKTNLLCRWASDLLDQGHAVLAYDCAALAQTDVEAEILRDLALPPGLPAVEAFERIDAEAGGAKRNLVVVFDSIGDYRGGEQNGVQLLLRRINALAGRDGRNIRVAVSCSAAIWSRMERRAPIRLEGERYFRSAGDEPFVRIGRFTPEELEAAWARYRGVFDLFSPFDELHPAVAERLRDPVLLRMVAETYRGSKQPLLPFHVGLGVYRRFFEERVQTDRERWLVDGLAAEMISRRSAALSITDLARHDDLGPEVLNEDAASTYSRLLDRGVLQEWRGNVRAGVLVKFAHGSVAAYALATHLLRRNPDVRTTTAELLDRNAQVPHAWEVAKALLLESGDAKAIAALARSRDPEERELAVEALVELHSGDVKAGSALLRSLLEQDAEEGRRTALKAAYNIGPPAREFFLKAAIDGDAAMRESVKNTLYLIWRNESAAGRRAVTDTAYLIWRHAPGFTHDLLNTLLGALVLKNITKFPGILEFVLDLTITIYINHCEEEDVKEKTAALLHELSTARLHLDLFNTGLLGDRFEKLVFAAVARVFADQILRWMLFADTVPIETFFERSAESRSALDRIADVFDPASRLESAHDDLVAMLQSGVPIFSGSAAMAIAVHAAHDFTATEPLVRRLWDEVNAEGRLWILASFSVLLNETPREWIPLLESLTRGYVAGHRDAFLGPASRLAGQLDIVLLPLGLAYGKNGSPMRVLDELLEQAMTAGDDAMAARCVAALAAVGFHYPDAVFGVLRPVMNEAWENEAISGAVVGTLATIRTLHFDAVDEFLHRESVPDEVRRQIDAAADVTLVHRLIRVLGYYNNAVHFTLHYPRMRKPLSVGALKLLAKARKPSEFVSDYTLTAMRMLRESKFQVLEWTRPE